MPFFAKNVFRFHFPACFVLNLSLFQGQRFPPSLFSAVFEDGRAIFAVLSLKLAFFKDGFLRRP